MHLRRYALLHKKYSIWQTQSRVITRDEHVANKSRRYRHRGPELAIELFGLCAVLAMVLMYALEARSPAFILGFTVACAAASLYAVLIHSWPFAAAEAIWAAIAFQRWRRVRLAWNREKGAIS